MFPYTYLFFLLNEVDSFGTVHYTFGTVNYTTRLSKILLMYVHNKSLCVLDVP